MNEKLYVKIFEDESVKIHQSESSINKYDMLQVLINIKMQNKYSIDKDPECGMYFDMRKLQKDCGISDYDYMDKILKELRNLDIAIENNGWLFTSHGSEDEEN